MAILTIRSDKGVKNRAVHLDFRWQQIPGLQNTVDQTWDFLKV